MPSNVREMHLRHPDGHVFRVGRGFEAEKWNWLPCQVKWV